jgi:uncharacterized protein (TIGR02145 family)
MPTAMNRILASLLLVLTTLLGHAQGSMNIYQTNGSILQVALSSIDSVTYQLAPPPPLMRIHQTGGSILSLAVADIDSITYSTGGAPGTPQVATLPATAVGSTSAVCAGTITADGGSSVNSRGICYGTGPLPDLTGPSVTSGAGLGGFQSFLSSLQPNTLYYARAYATNSQGTSYGNAVAFVTSGNTGGVLPTVITTQPTGITALSALVGGEVTNDGGNTVVARGVVWSTSPNPSLANSFTVDGAGMGSFTSALTGLGASTSYFARAYATNGNGTVYGGAFQFTTLNGVPILNTIFPFNVTPTAAVSGGQIVSDGGAPVTARGVCWSTNPNPTISDNLTSDALGGISYESTLTNLLPGTIYFLRAYATNSFTTAYGEQQQLTTSGLVDSDGNIYNSVIIGGQEWMGENLRTTTYSNGDAIPNVTDGGAWISLNDGAWSYYQNSMVYQNPYGKLYNWHVTSDPRNVCPSGWHVPTDGELTQLSNFLGGASVAGGKMKSTGTQYWQAPNIGASNESGFSAHPGGGRSYFNGAFGDMGIIGYVWSSSETGQNTAVSYSLGSSSATLFRADQTFKVAGASVRCLRD